MHVKVNGKYVNIPSFQVNPNDKIEIEEAAKKIPFIAAALAAAGNRQQASWLEVNKETFSGTFKSMPVRDRKSTRLNSSHSQISYAVFCLKKKKKKNKNIR